MPLADQAIEHEEADRTTQPRAMRIEAFTCALDTAEYSARACCLMDERSQALAAERTEGDNLGLRALCAETVLRAGSALP
ncbi:MAG TPA: hypothetical protein VN705_17035 [Steroidobacteraceae bacterium]|jgi:hypothetical protein|nr:hypothetical protein [Steroidobacteraceae bacterium]